MRKFKSYNPIRSVRGAALLAGMFLLLVGTVWYVGGSFQCHEDMCHGYTVYARSHTTPETSLFHGGFRTVKDVD